MCTIAFGSKNLLACIALFTSIIAFGPPPPKNKRTDRSSKVSLLSRNPSAFSERLGRLAVAHKPNDKTPKKNFKIQRPGFHPCPHSIVTYLALKLSTATLIFPYRKFLALSSCPGINGPIVPPFSV